MQAASGSPATEASFLHTFQPVKTLASWTTSFWVYPPSTDIV
jgi:hypothetical protein